MVAINAVYHRACLTTLYSQATTVGCDKTENHANHVITAHVMNDLLDFIEENQGTRESMATTDLTALYDKRIAALTVYHLKCNTTRHREDVARLIPDIKPVQRNHCLSVYLIRTSANLRSR